MRFGLSRFTRAQGHQKTPTASLRRAGDTALIEDIVIGSRILAEFGVLDGFGHVSARDPNNPNHFLMSRSLAPALVTADDIMEFDLDGNAIDPSGRSLVPGTLHSQRDLQGAAGRDVGGPHPFARGNSVRREPGAAAGDVSQRSLSGGRHAGMGHP